MALWIILIMVNLALLTLANRLSTRNGNKGETLNIIPMIVISLFYFLGTSIAILFIIYALIENRKLQFVSDLVDYVQGKS